VTNLDVFEKRLADHGLKFDAPVRQVQNGRTRVAFFTDPWGALSPVLRSGFGTLRTGL